MKKEEALKYIDDKGDSSFVVRTEEEETTFLANHAKKIEEDIIPSKIGDLHKRYDDDVFSVTGIKKEPTEKTYDFIKRILSDMKTKAEKGDAFEAEIATLKQQIKDGTGDRQTVLDLEATKKAYKELQESSTREINTLKTEHQTFKAESMIRAALPAMSIKKGVPEEAAQALINQAVTNLLVMSSFDDTGKLQFIENGTVKRNVHNKGFTASTR